MATNLLLVLAVLCSLVMPHLEAAPEPPQAPLAPSAPVAPPVAPSGGQVADSGGAKDEALVAKEEAILVRQKQQPKNKKKKTHSKPSKMFDYSVYGKDCPKAVLAMRDTIDQWDNLIRGLRATLAKHHHQPVAPTPGPGTAPVPALEEVKLSPKSRAQLESRLGTLERHADTARRALKEGNLKQVNQSCHQGGFELAKLAFNAETSRLEPQLAVNARQARQIYKTYRQACGGPAY